tara:strand:- start:671 stop:1039 length:369 start_codon:yes stop_codon:yes gene_type:complete
MKKIISIIIGVSMIFGAIGHITSPEAYTELIPSFIPEFIAHLFAIGAEAAIGVALIVPKFRTYGGLGLMVLMIAFLPIHIWDMLKDEPFIGTKTIAVVRIAVQILLIYIGWWISKNKKQVKS